VNRLALWGVLVAAVSAGAPPVPSPWEVVRTEPDGLVLEARSTPDSAFSELRVRATTSVSPAVVAERIWTRRADSVEGRLTERSEVLYESDTERLLYVRLRLPAVSRRDYTMRYRRQVEPVKGAMRIDFALDDAAGPAPTPEVVRMRLARGSWTIEPARGGGAIVTYQVLSDPAGNVPVWVASGEQKEIAIQMVREVILPPLRR